jgi:hypothetical protein
VAEKETDLGEHLGFWCKYPGFCNAPAPEAVAPQGVLTGQLESTTARLSAGWRLLSCDALSRLPQGVGAALESSLLAVRHVWDQSPEDTRPADHARQR